MAFHRFDHSVLFIFVESLHKGVIWVFALPYLAVGSNSFELLCGVDDVLDFLGFWFHRWAIALANNDAKVQVHVRSLKTFECFGFIGAVQLS